MDQPEASLRSIVHALIASDPFPDTLCGKRFGSLSIGESSVSMPVADPAWITCPACREYLDAHNMALEDYSPRSTLVVPQRHPECARYPFIDIHNHQNSLMSGEQLDRLVKDMDALNLRVMVNLSGGFGETLELAVQNMRGRYPARFVIFANIDFSNINDPDYSHRVAQRFEEDACHGAQGLKIYKNFGMDFTDAHGRRIPVDDGRFDGLFETCARLNTPVLIHTADPRPFFEPVDRYNERWLELKTVPTRRHPPNRSPAWQTLIDEQHRLFQKHPNTIFINAHLGWLGGDLDQLGRLMDRLPNMYTEIGAVLAEIGRQPRHARTWFIQYQDRILFGKDGWNPSEYRTYFRVLETSDEYFDYYRKYHAFWKMYGLDLPDEVLRKVYYENALRILPGIVAEPFPMRGELRS